jgi:putative ATPase
VAAQQYLPDDLAGATDYFRPTGRGFEERLVGRLQWLKDRLAGQSPKESRPGASPPVD